MIVQLRINKANATGGDMQGRITSLLLVFAILFGTVIMPTVAHAQAASASHAEEFLDIHEVDSDAGQDTRDDDGEKPCHAVAHHHCSMALRIDGPPRTMTLTAAQNSFVASLHAAMASLSQAPPTEPPAA
ncbi:MAG: hypothetical protein ABL928_01760 [Sphingorhabdus sp.]|jgi:hypothetical protein